MGEGEDAVCVGGRGRGVQSNPLDCVIFMGNFVEILIKLASVAQLDAPSDWRPGGRGFNPRRGRQHSFVEIDHEIFIFYGHSLPSADSRRAVVSFWRKNVHNTG